MLSEELDRTVGQRITLRAPAVPTDVGMNVLSVKADCFQNSQRLRQYLVSDAVSRHGNNCVVPHHWLLESSTAETPSTPRGPQLNRIVILTLSAAEGEGPLHFSAYSASGRETNLSHAQPLRHQILSSAGNH